MPNTYILGMHRCFQSKYSNISAEGLHFSAFHYNSKHYNYCNIHMGHNSGIILDLVKRMSPNPVLSQNREVMLLERKHSQ